MGLHARIATVIYITKNRIDIDIGIRIGIALHEKCLLHSHMSKVCGKGDFRVNLNQRWCTFNAYQRYSEAAVKCFVFFIKEYFIATKQEF